MTILNKTWIWILIAIIVLVFFWAVWQYGLFNRLATQEGSSLLDNDTTAAIENDLNAVDIGNPDDDLQQLDADLNQL